VARAKPTEETSRHFTGVPAPAGAMLGLFPVFLYMSDTIDITEYPMLVALWLGFVGFLMISQIKTFSPKSIRVPRKLVSLAMVAVVIGIGMFVAHLWMLMVAVDLVYLASVFWAIGKSRGRVIE